MTSKGMQGGLGPGSDPATCPSREILRWLQITYGAHGARDSMRAAGELSG